jgi:hypothetical protein
VALVSLFAVPFLSSMSAADKGITFIGMGLVPGSALHEFLVLEHDNRSNVLTPPNDKQTPNLKRI